MSATIGSLSDAPYPGYAGPEGLRTDMPASPPRRPGAAQAAPHPVERPRLRDLRRPADARPRPARSDRYARWHVPEAPEQESESWLLPYLDLLTLLLALLVALLAITRMDAGRAAGPDAQAQPVPVRLVGSIGSGSLPAAPVGDLPDLPAIPADWATPPAVAWAGGQPPSPHSTEPVGPGMTAAVPLPQGTSAAAAVPGIGGTDTARHADGPAAAVPPGAAAASSHDSTTPAGDGPPAAPDLPAEPQAPLPSIEELGLDELGDSVDVIVNAQSISLRISNELLFPPGQAELGPAGLEVLRRLAGVVNRNDYRLSVEGHSDAVPIQTERYPSNWELSTARATSVLRQLERYGVASERLSATGYAHTRPIASNGSVSGRAANRRVELIMHTGEPRRDSAKPLP